QCWQTPANNIPSSLSVAHQWPCRPTQSLILVVLVPLAAVAGTSSPAVKLPVLLRLYVLGCGEIHVADTARYELRREEVETSQLSVACFLVVHPKGALIWDVGAVPDSEWQPTGSR